MKIGFVSFLFGEYSVRLASALAEHASVMLLLPEGMADPFLEYLDERVILRTFRRPRYRQPLRNLRLNRWIFRQLREFGADVIHFQQGSLWFNLSLLLERRFPIVLTVHDAEQHVGDKLSQKTPYCIWKWGFHRADQIIVHSEFVKNQLTKQVGIPSSRITTVPHIQIGHGTEAAVDSLDDGKTVLFFGRIWPYKGLEYLIRAERQITEKVPDVRIVIAGAGENFERYRQEMENPERFVVHNRRIPEDEAEQLFREASVVVLPYIESSQSGVIPVAYSHAKPVIATTVGGLPETVIDEVTGLLVPPRDERRLADAVVALLTNGDLRNRMGQEGKRRLERECAPDKVAQQTIDVFRCACPAAQRKPVESSPSPVLMRQ
ncbi:MAG: glycosyltransferase family 4 protein [Acidobacteriaceae bacterium]